MTEELEWKTRRERINTKLTGFPQPLRIIKYRDELIPPAWISKQLQKTTPTYIRWGHLPQGPKMYSIASI